jgi:hypothetical protein
MDGSQLIDLLQWPAMVTTASAAWMVGSLHKNRRQTGFYVFLLSNVLWIIWGWHAGAWALIVLQLALAVINFRGVFKNETSAGYCAPHRLQQPDA